MSVVVVECAQGRFDPAPVLEALERDGAVVLRGAFARESVDFVAAEALRWLEKPAIAGAPGYWKIDHPKKLLDPCVIGGPVYELIANEAILDLADAFLDSVAVLAECNLKYDAPVGYGYFPFHTDFFVGWRKKDGTLPVLDAATLRKPLGLGGAIYLHDTREGAFCYCLGSQKRDVPLGWQDIGNVPPAVRREIEATKVRIDGLKGDIVLFDDRGYHGPEMPMPVSRTVILVDYYSTAVFGRTLVTPYSIWSTDLHRLSARQMRALGAGAAAWGDPWTSLHAKFRRNPFYKAIAAAVENAYLHRHVRARLRALLGR
jgi:hypothetical protein